MRTQTRIQQSYEEHCTEEVETNRSKSRIDEMKYREYLQIKKSKKGYLQDFLSVLEDGDKNINQSIDHSNRSKEILPEVRL